jgi:uncharacterized protein with von Willebrand factor type A (vWA) domain
MPTNPVVDARATGLVAALRIAGLAVPVGSVVTFVDALTRLDDSVRSVYWAGRVTLAHSPMELDLYDETFRLWLLGGEPVPAQASMTDTVTLPVDDDDAHDGAQPDVGEGDADPIRAIRFSRTEVLRTRDFAELDEDERAEVDRLLADLRLVGETRRSRRRRPSRRLEGRPDLRRTVRDSLRTGGEPFARRTLTRTRTPRRVVILADISGSMESYSRALVRFAHAAVAARARVEAFTLGTRLTRLTRELATHDPDVALARVAAAVLDWSGGTRLGDGLRRFNDEWGTRGMARGAIVVILSDGWDRGDPSELAAEMARLRRVAHRIVWVNPLKASPDYAPLAKGMAAALPFVDEFIEGHSLDSLDELSRIVAAPSARSSHVGIAATQEVTR